MARNSKQQRGLENKLPSCKQKTLPPPQKRENQVHYKRSQTAMVIKCYSLINEICKTALVHGKYSFVTAHTHDVPQALVPTFNEESPEKYRTNHN